ncbi:hypothetical protein HRTV-11_gp70 [Halorubrum virus HRTV-11]|nr:hypothetical protein HRTV-11_gp70 [Halorubrum virus HRTV-11]
MNNCRCRPCGDLCRCSCHDESRSLSPVSLPPATPDHELIRKRLPPAV